MELEIVPLLDGHLEDAAALVTTRYRSLRQHVASVPTQYEESALILPLLGDLASRERGVAAVHSERLVGFLLGQVLPSFRGKRSVYSPEWANAAKPRDCRRIYQSMYAHLSSRWVTDGCLTYIVTLFADDREAIDAWFWEEFGLIAVDAVRDVSPVCGPTSQADVRRATLEDVDSVMRLSQKLRRHLASAPTFLWREEVPQRSLFEQLLVDSSRPHWLAFRGEEAVALMNLGPANPDACHIIRDERTSSVLGGFTEESMRGQGIGTALLSCSLEWAHSAGYTRCAVDFEPANVLASRFWLRHFHPVCYSLIR